MTVVVEVSTPAGQVDDVSPSQSGGSAALSLRAVRHAYGKRSAPVLSGVDLDVGSGEVVALLGPSGCGKTTLLRIVAGLIRPTGGQVVMAGRDLTRVATHKRNIGLVHQNFALWPHLTVADNVAFGLDMRRWDRAARVGRVEAMLDLVGLAGYQGRFPRQLSGGQQQRVALARALAFEPTVLLLDEPLSSLDANLRAQLQAHLRHLQRTTSVTTVLVTHDREEAMSVANRIVVLEGGVVQQVAAGPELYRKPASPFVMSFTGESNMYGGAVDAAGTVVVPGLGPVAPAPAGCPPGAVVSVGFRPECVSVAPGPAGFDTSWTGRVQDAAFLGPIATYEIAVESGTVITARREIPMDGALLPIGSTVCCGVSQSAIHVFPTTTLKGCT